MRFHLCWFFSSSYSKFNIFGAIHRSSYSAKIIFGLINLFLSFLSHFCIAPERNGKKWWRLKTFWMIWYLVLHANANISLDRWNWPCKTESTFIFHFAFDTWKTRTWNIQYATSIELRSWYRPDLWGSKTKMNEWKWMVKCIFGENFYYYLY